MAKVQAYSNPASSITMDDFEDDFETVKFINFYIIKTLWMHYKHEMRDLREKFFGMENSKSSLTGKTKYDNILALKPVEINEDRLSELTGLHRDYFVGSKRKIIGIDDLMPGDWLDYLKLRQAHKGNRNSDKKSEKERFIKDKIIEMIKKKPQGIEFATINHFCHHMVRNNNSDPIRDRAILVKEYVSRFTKADLQELLKKNELDDYVKVLREHLLLAEATIVLSKFS